MTLQRRLAWLALGVAFVHSVFGAIVRISGSGMGCGEHWPDCNGALVPTFTSYTTVIELTHRCLAATLLGVTAALVLVAWRDGRTGTAAKRGGSVLRAAALALGLELVAALVGMVVVLLALSSRALIAVHYTIAMATLATLVIAVQRTGGSGSGERAPWRRLAAHLPRRAGRRHPGVHHGCLRGAHREPGRGGGIVSRFSVVPARDDGPQRDPARADHTPGPGHSAVSAPARPRDRDHARRESPVLVRAGWTAFGIVVLQIVIAASLVELRLPPALQSLHQATGTLVWIAAFALAALARRAALPALVMQPVGTARAAGAAGAMA